MCRTNKVPELFIFIQNNPMHKISTTVLALTLILALASCSKSPAPSTSFIATKYLGIDHLYTCQGLELDSDRYLIKGDESGSTNKLQMSMTHVTRGNYALGQNADNEVIFWVAGDTYTSHIHGATGSIAVNAIDTTIFNIHATFNGHLINASDSTDYLDVSGEFNVKYQH